MKWDDYSSAEHLAYGADPSFQWIPGRGYVGFAERPSASNVWRGVRTPPPDERTPGERLLDCVRKQAAAGRRWAVKALEDGYFTYPTSGQRVDL